MKKSLLAAALVLAISGTGCATVSGMVQAIVGEQHEAPKTPEMDRVRGEKSDSTTGVDTVCCAPPPPVPTARIRATGLRPDVE